MNHESVLMPHPILRLVNSDYGDDESFDMEKARARLLGGHVVIEASFELSCRRLEEMIDGGQASFFVLVQCSETSYRCADTTRERKIAITIKSDDLSGKMTLTPYVIASSEVPRFGTAQYDEDLNIGGEDIPLGSILAVGRSQEVEIDDIGPLHSALHLTSNDKIEPGKYVIGVEGERIVVEMEHSTYEAVTRIRKNGNDLLYSSVYQPAIEHAIREMENHDGSKWVAVLKKTLSEHGIEIDDTTPKRAHEHAQTLLGKPLERLIRWERRLDELG